MFFLDYIWLIPLLPAFGAAAMFFVGRKMQKSAVSAVCVGVVVVAFVWACGSVWQYTDWAARHGHDPFQQILYTWLGSDTGHLNYITYNGAPAAFHADAGFLLDPLFDWIGHSLLLAPSLRGLWTSLYNTPIIPLTNFNNTVVLGSLVFALLAAVPLFFILRWAVARYRVTVGERVRQSRFYRAVMASKVYNVYKMFRP